jgi:invasion protein IalB
MGREKTVQELNDSGSGPRRRRLPHGLKWQSGMNQPGAQKYINCTPTRAIRALS